MAEVRNSYSSSEDSMHDKDELRKNTPLKCDESDCDYSTASKKHLDDHVLSVQKDRAKESEIGKEFEFHCNECSFSVGKKRRLKIHVLIKHFGVVRFICSLCSYKNYSDKLIQRIIIF